MSNNKPIIHNLDEKKNDPEYIRLGGINMDISFIPCGIAIPLLNTYDSWVEYNKEAGGVEGIIKDSNKAHESALLMAKTLSIFTKFYKQELNEEWILKNISMKNLGFAINKLVHTITDRNVEKDNVKISKEEAKKKENQLNGNEQ